MNRRNIRGPRSFIQCSYHATPVLRLRSSPSSHLPSCLSACLSAFRHAEMTGSVKREVLGVRARRTGSPNLQSWRRSPNLHAAASTTFRCTQGGRTSPTGRYVRSTNSTSTPNFTNIFTITHDKKRDECNTMIHRRLT